MEQFLCYYHETIYVNGRAYNGKRINDAVFRTESEAERYCRTHVGIQKTADGYVENDMNYDKIGGQNG